MKKILYTALAVCCLSSVFLTTAACGEKADVTLNVASWEEYIDEGGKDGYDAAELGHSKKKAMYEEFESWFKEKTGKTVKVNYVPLQDNETMYTNITMGNKYDLLCPSEYMIIKLANEGYLKQYPDSFFDTTIEENYYAKGVSSYIENIFDSNEINGVKWSKYAAGYMWGTTGFTYNTATVSAEDVKSWNVYTNTNYKISAKNNVRDSYFMGLGMLNESELLDLGAALTAGTLSLTDYKAQISAIMNDTQAETMNKVKPLLTAMKKRDNFWGFETDEAKDAIIKDSLDISYQWSGDAIYIMDFVEDDDLTYAYAIPEAASNLWFDGWVMMKNDETDEEQAALKEQAATMFVNFISRPDNVVRNMYYIGYTSCISGVEAYDDISVFDYISDTYSAEEDETDTSEYDLSYFFGDDHVLTVPSEQLYRQLFAQYPDEKTMERCVVMSYFDSDANNRANTLWNDVKGGS
jgi:spermidine/putrescine transport system substrate-binding protein